MSYNGIGLQTPRGSGTNGHISKNLSSIKRREPYQSSAIDSVVQYETKRHADLGILQHEAKRQIQNRLLVYRTELEDANPPMSETEIEEAVQSYRKKVEDEARQNLYTGKERHKAYQSHDIAVSKTKEMDVLRSALGVAEDYEEGAAIKKSIGTEPSVVQDGGHYDPNAEVRVNPLDRRHRRDYERDHDDNRHRGRASDRSRRAYDEDLDRHRRRGKRRSSPDIWKHERTDFRPDARRPEDQQRSRDTRPSRSSRRRVSRSRSRSRSRRRYSRSASRSPKPSRRHKSRSRSRSRSRTRSSSRSVSVARRRQRAPSSPRRRRSSPDGASRSRAPAHEVAAESATKEVPVAAAPVRRSPSPPVFDRRKALGID